MNIKPLNSILKYNHILYRRQSNSKIMQLDCVAQTYAWGIKGNKSLVAKFKKTCNSEFIVDKNESYAEIWMGTHSSGPSKIKESNIYLSEWLSDKPSKVGFVPEEYPKNDLPFLFKVLSISTALSIQTHPDKKLATELHEKFPELYKDSNHKPEMVIALSHQFECMCGFRSLSDIYQNLLCFPELQAIIDHNNTDSIIQRLINFKDSTEEELKELLLKDLFRKYITCCNEYSNQQLLIMINRLENILLINNRCLTSLEILILKLNSQYPHDNGVFSPLIMNYICLQKGDCFYISANELHAYISGECIECMALSDNVVRAGLTPKYKDCKTLCDMLIYRSRLPNTLNPIALDAYRSLYRPPVETFAEFEVEVINIPSNTMNYLLVQVPCGSMIMIMKQQQEQQSALIQLNNNENILTTITSHTNNTNHNINDYRTNTNKDDVITNTDIDIIANIKSNINNIDIEVKNYSIFFLIANEEILISTKTENISIYRAHVNLGAF